MIWERVHTGERLEGLVSKLDSFLGEMELWFDFESLDNLISALKATALMAYRALLPIPEFTESSGRIHPQQVTQGIEAVSS